jgi:hypothetical protein
MQVSESGTYNKRRINAMKKSRDFITWPLSPFFISLLWSSVAFRRLLGADMHDEPAFE